jgi:hypothetical protein
MPLKMVGVFREEKQMDVRFVLFSCFLFLPSPFGIQGKKRRGEKPKQTGKEKKREERKEKIKKKKKP